MMLVAMLIAVAAIAVPFVLYPALLWLRSVLSQNPVKSDAITPHVDLVICAHNESATIAQRVQNALKLDYPHERLRIWIASDGSTDATVQVAREAASGDGRVRVLDLPRTGKAGALIVAVQEGSAPVIAFSDANSEWCENALRCLVAPLADASVGGVAGDQRYRKSRNAGESSGEQGYWSFDRLLKGWQSAAGSTISATGAIYCVRRTLFQPPPPDATDDFMISTGVVHAGKRLVFAADACAEEMPAASTGLEYQRKVRVISRGLRGVIYRRALLNPFRTGLYGLQLLVHKLWRRLVWIPLLFLVILAPWAIVQGGLAAFIGVTVLAAVTLGVTGMLSEHLRQWRVFSVPAYVLVVNLACMVSVINLLRGKRIASWQLQREVGAPR